MKNPRISNKEWGLLKGAINRVFSRSDLRKEALALSVISGYTDSSRRRVTKWSRCAGCKKPTPSYLIDIDHIVTRVPLGVEFKEMSVDEYIDRTWCELSTLQALCESCHSEKTSKEREIKKLMKKEKKANEAKGTKRAAKTSSKRTIRRRANKSIRRKTY